MRVAGTIRSPALQSVIVMPTSMPRVDLFAADERAYLRAAVAGRRIGRVSGQSARGGVAAYRFGKCVAPAPGAWLGLPIAGGGPLYNLEALSYAKVRDAALVPTFQSIRRRNVLLFDFVLKRQLRFGAATLASSVFMARHTLA